MKSFPVPKQVVVVRERWYRGQGDAFSMLLRPKDRKMCCLGFWMCAAGATEKDIESYVSPRSLARIRECDIDGLVDTDYYNSKQNSDICGEMMRTNDEVRMEEASRELALIQQAARLGTKLVFVDTQAEADLLKEQEQSDEVVDRHDGEHGEGEGKVGMEGVEA